MHDSQVGPAASGGGDTLQWQRVGALFDAVCDLPAEQWEDALVQLGHDVEDIRATLALLRARTQQLHSVERAMASARTLEPIAPDAMVGQLLGPWKLLQPIGMGGMGVVFLASRDDALYQRRVAIKLLQKRHDGPSAERLVEERQILANLEIPGIARLYDAGISGDGRAYLVMEYVEGTALDAHATVLDLPTRLRLMMAICGIVHRAHTQLIVHCDLKPGNILVDAEGRPVLLDFGIARLLGEARPGAAQPALFASPAYGSPELLDGRSVGAPADVFSLGVMLAELLTGQPSSRRLQDVRTPLARPSTQATLAPALRRRLRGDLDAIVAKACALQPADRYQGTDALARDLARYLEHRPVSARPRARWRATGLALRRHWRSALVALAVVTGAALLVNRLADARSQAEDNAVLASHVSDFLAASFQAVDPVIQQGRESSAREVLDQARIRIDQDLSAAPALRARLNTVLGRAYMNLGQPRVATELLTQAAADLVRAGDRTQAAGVHADLSRLSSQSGAYPRAIEQARHAATLLDLPGADSPQARLASLHALAVAQAGMGDAAAAQTVLQQALALASTQRGSEGSHATLEVMRSLGAVYRTKGQLERSTAILEQALAVSAKTHGTQSVEYQRSLYALSSTQQAAGRTEQATTQAEQAVALARHLYGANSRHTVDAERWLAGMYLDFGHYHAAARTFEQALRSVESVEGPRSTTWASARFGYGVVKEASGDLPAALAIYREALDLNQQLLGHEHPGPMGMQMSLARLLMRMQRLDEAAPLLQDAASFQRARAGEDSPGAIAIELIEVEWDIRSDRFAQARARLDRLADVRDTLPKPLWLRWRMQDALLATRSGRHADAATNWGKVVEIFSDQYGSDSTATAKWRVIWADALFRDDQREPARRELARALPALTELAVNADFLQTARPLARALRIPLPADLPQPRESATDSSIDLDVLPIAQW